MPSTDTRAHLCHFSYVRVGDTIVRTDGSRAVVTDVQHYRQPFAGRVADVRTDDGRRYNGVGIAAVIGVVSGPDHPGTDAH